MIEDSADANILCDDNHLPQYTYTQGYDKRVSIDSMEGLELVVIIQQNFERDNDERMDIVL